MAFTRPSSVTLAAACLGWGLDRYETQALIVVLLPAMHDLLGAGQSGNTALRTCFRTARGSST
jgi:hypothetical protein